MSGLFDARSMPVGMDGSRCCSLRGVVVARNISFCVATLSSSRFSRSLSDIRSVDRDSMDLSFNSRSLTCLSFLSRNARCLESF